MATFQSGSVNASMRVFNGCAWAISCGVRSSGRSLSSRPETAIWPDAKSAWRFSKASPAVDAAMAARSASATAFFSVTIAGACTACVIAAVSRFSLARTACSRSKVSRRTRRPAVALSSWYSIIVAASAAGER